MIQFLSSGVCDKGLSVTMLRAPELFVIMLDRV